MRVLIWAAVSSKAQTAREKMSLPDQEARGLAWAASAGGRVVDILRVPGHSRRYTSLRDVAIAANRKGIDAFTRLDTHLEARDFDVLWVRDADRIGRTQALVAEITERLIAGGARIYSDGDGWVDSQNFRMWVAMAGYKAAASIDGFVKARQATFVQLLNGGMRPTGRMPFSHRYVYSPDTGLRIGIAVQEALAPVFADMAALLLDGVSWRQLDLVMQHDYGHTHLDGHAFSHGLLRSTIMNVVFWGHVAYHYSPTDSPHLRGAWVFDDHEEPPDGVLLKRHTHEAIYTGAVADSVRDELRRRAVVVKGRSYPQHTQRFAGLFVCGGCGYTMVTTNTRKAERTYYMLRCTANNSPRLQACPNPQYLSVSKAQRQLDARLRVLLDSPSVEHLFATAPEVDYASQRHTLQTSLDECERQIRNLIGAQARAPEGAAALYQDEIAHLTERLEHLKQQQRHITDEQARASRAQAALLAGLDQLRESSVDALWQRSDREINQVLISIFADYQIVIEGKKLVDLQPRRVAPRR